MDSYLFSIFYTLVKVIRENVDEFIVRITVSYWNWQRLCLLESIDAIHFWTSSFMCDLLKNSIIPTFSAKVMFAQCYWSFEIHFTPSPGSSESNLLLRTWMFAQRRFLITFKRFFLNPHLLLLDNLEVLRKFPCTGKITSPVII